MRSVAFQSILRKRIRKLPTFLKILKIIQFYSILFNRVLSKAVAQFAPGDYRDKVNEKPTARVAAELLPAACGNRPPFRHESPGQEDEVEKEDGLRLRALFLTCF